LTGNIITCDKWIHETAEKICTKWEDRTQQYRDEFAAKFVPMHNDIKAKLETLRDEYDFISSEEEM